jgi:hypothetical protein
MHLGRWMLVHCVPSPRHVARYMPSPRRVRSILLLRETSRALPAAIVSERDEGTEVTNCDFSVEQTDE